MLLRTGRKLRPQSFSLLRRSLKRKVNREPHSVAKAKKAGLAFLIQRSGLFLFSSFMEAPSIRHPFFVLRLFFIGLITFTFLILSKRKVKKKSGAGVKGKTPILK